MFLNLSKNPFTNLPLKCFWGSFYLKILDLGAMKFKMVQPESFTFTNVKIIKTLDYKLSCVSSVTHIVQLILLGMYLVLISCQAPY